LDSWQDPAGELDEFFFCLVIQFLPPMFVGFKEVVHHLFWIQYAFLFPLPDLFVPGKENEGYNIFQ